MQRTATFNKRENNDEISGLLLGFIAIVGFSVTLPATRIAVNSIDPVLVGPGRSLLALIPALIILYALKIPLPTRKQALELSLVSLGVVICFPWLTSIAMQNISGAQGGIVVSVLPLFTAISGALLLKQRPSAEFWFMALLGSALVLIYLFWSQQGKIQSSELILLLASVLCAIGYAQGGKLAQDMGGVAVISWAIIFSAPFSIVPVIYIWQGDMNTQELWSRLSSIPWQAWSGFIYISFISQWLAFIFWYRGLALGGVVRVSQVQLVQPFLTFFVSALLLDESITILMMLFAMAVVVTVAIGRKMPVYAQ